jgi:hypothetical protein
LLVTSSKTHSLKTKEHKTLRRCFAASPSWRWLLQLLTAKYSDLQDSSSTAGQRVLQAKHLAVLPIDGEKYVY